MLLPLHLPAARLDGTSPVLGLYHEPLVQCLVLLLGRQPALLTDALPPLLAGWPTPREGNSSKEVPSPNPNPNTNPNPNPNTNPNTNTNTNTNPNL